jgi:hypothetical protein
MNDSNPDADRESEEVDFEIYEGDPEFTSSATENGEPDGYQDDGDLS